MNTVNIGCPSISLKTVVSTNIYITSLMSLVSLLMSHKEIGTVTGRDWSGRTSRCRGMYVVCIHAKTATGETEVYHVSSVNAAFAL